MSSNDIVATPADGGDVTVTDDLHPDLPPFGLDSITSQALHDCRVQPVQAALHSHTAFVEIGDVAGDQSVFDDVQNGGDLPLTGSLSIRHKCLAGRTPVKALEQFTGACHSNAIMLLAMLTITMGCHAQGSDAVRETDRSISPTLIVAQPTVIVPTPTREFDKAISSTPTKTQAPVFVPAPATEPDKPINPTTAPTQPGLIDSVPTPDPGGNALYQGYEHGFMVLAFGEISTSLLRKNCIYAYSFAGDQHIISPYSLGFTLHADRDWFHYCVYLDDIYPDLAVSSVDVARLKGAFRELGSNAVIQTNLGNPVDEIVLYYASIPANLPQNMSPEGAWYLPMISLPDGSALFCGSRGATGDTCYVGS